MRKNFLDFLATLTARDRLFFTLMNLYNHAEDENSSLFYQKLIRDTCLEDSEKNPDTESGSDSDLSHESKIKNMISRGKDAVTQKEETILGAWDAMKGWDGSDDSNESDSSDESDDVPPLVPIESKSPEPNSSKESSVPNAPKKSAMNNPLTQSTIVPRTLKFAEQ